MKKVMIWLTALLLSLAMAAGACALDVILLRDVPGKGKAGNTVRVAESFARDFLFPKNLARLPEPIVLPEKRAATKRKSSAGTMKRHS